jgi:hypothetical protein
VGKFQSVTELRRPGRFHSSSASFPPQLQNVHCGEVHKRRSVYSARLHKRDRIQIGKGTTKPTKQIPDGNQPEQPNTNPRIIEQNVAVLYMTMPPRGKHSFRNFCGQTRTTDTPALSCRRVYDLNTHLPFFSFPVRKVTEKYKKKYFDVVHSGIQH